MTSDRDTCSEGMKWFKNSRDLSKECRDAAIARANAMADKKEASSPAKPYLTSFTSSSQKDLSVTSNTTHQDSGSSTEVHVMVCARTDKEGAHDTGNAWRGGVCATSTR